MNQPRVRALGASLTTREYVEWAMFERHFGPLTLHERIDQGFAMLAYVVAKSAGAEVEFEDFLPRWGHEEPVGDATDWLRAMAS